MLFSATLTPKTADLAKLSLKKEPLYIGIDDNKEEATVSSLEQVSYFKFKYLSVRLFKFLIFIQGYVIVPSEKRFLLLFTFLKKNKKKKIMVFFSSCMSVKFHHELLNYIDMPVMCIHVS